MLVQGNGNVDNPSSVTQIANAESIVVEKNKSSNSCQETVENKIPILKTNPYKRKQLATTNYIPKKNVCRRSKED